MRYGLTGFVVTALLLVASITWLWAHPVARRHSRGPGAGAETRHQPVPTPGLARVPEDSTQVGLGRVPTVVIDPGHGGSNTGAPGLVPGVYEKHITLPLARRLAAELRGRGYRVVMTRESDEYLTLRRRMELGHEAGGDLFISLHANAAPGRDRRGFETFVLTPEAMDIDSRALRHTAGSAVKGVDPATAQVVAEIDRQFAHGRAAVVAASIQRALREVRGQEHDRGVKQANMHVLLGAAMPAVLVEVGFLDHAVEGRELLDSAMQAGLAQALAQAVAEVVPAPGDARVSRSSAGESLDKVDG